MLEEAKYLQCTRRKSFPWNLSLVFEVRSRASGWVKMRPGGPSEPFLHREELLGKNGRWLHISNTPSHCCLTSTIQSILVPSQGKSLQLCPIYLRHSDEPIWIKFSDANLTKLSRSCSLVAITSDSDGKKTTCCKQKLCSLKACLVSRLKWDKVLAWVAGSMDKQRVEGDGGV